MNSVLFITTGGTIEKCYHAEKGSLSFFRAKTVEDIIWKAQVWGCTFQRLMSKDSSLMTDQDRELIVECCNESHFDKIIVVHGTSTMIETANVLAEKVKGKTIVLTGALYPMSSQGPFGESDAVFNIASAYTAVHMLPHSVFIAMNGNVYPHDSVIKKDGMFFDKFEKDE